MYGKYGIQALADGGSGPVRLDKTGKLVTASSGGKYAELALNGKLFYAANQTPVNTSTTLNTTFTGLGIANPSDSGKLLVVHEFGFALVKAGAAGDVLALATTTSSGFAAAITPQCCRYGYGSSVAIVDDGATIIAPVIIKIVAALGNAATTTWPNLPAVVNLEGSIIIAPGRALVTDTTVATGATSIQFSFMWEEINI